MNRKWIYWVSAVIVALVLFSGLQGWAQSRVGIKCTRHHPRVHYRKNNVWRHPEGLYRAEDPQGEMFKIATVVDQANYGRYPTSWTYLKPTDRKHVKGYFNGIPLVRKHTLCLSGPPLPGWSPF